MAEGLIDWAAFAVDGSLIAADANKQRSAAGSDEVDWQALARTRRSVEATRAIRQAEVGAARTMIERTEERLGSAEMLGWLVNERAIEPHIPVFDKSARTNAIRRFDPSRPNQPLAQPERVDSLWQKALQFLRFSCGCLESWSLEYDNLGENSSKVSGPDRRNSRFRGDDWRRLVRSLLSGWAGRRSPAASRASFARCQVRRLLTEAKQTHDWSCARVR